MNADKLAAAQKAMREHGLQLVRPRRPHRSRVKVVKLCPKCGQEMRNAPEYFSCPKCEHFIGKELR